MIRTVTGELLSFDGYTSDLELDRLDQPNETTGSISHATLSAAELEFIFDLCVAGKMLIINPQSPPGWIIPGRTHSPDDVEHDDDTVWVDSAQELAEVLTPGFARFREFRDRALGRYGGERT